MSKTHVNLFIGRPRKMLTFLGLWMCLKKNILWKIYIAFILLTQYAFLIFEIIYIAGVWGDLGAVSEASYLLFTQLSVCFKTTMFLLNEKYLVTLLDLMENEVFDSQSKNHDRIVFLVSQRINRVCLFFLASAVPAVTLWVSIPLFDNSGPRSFPFMIWMPVTTETSPSYELGYAYQAVAISLGAFIFIVMDYVPLAMIMYGCAQLDIVMDKLEKVQSVPGPSDKNQKIREELLKSNNHLFTDCLRRHQAVVSFIDLMENVFHAPIFFQLMGTVLIICIIGIRLTIVERGSASFYSMINFLVSMLMQLLLYCWTGHELTIRSDVLRDCLYLCPWYEQDIKYRRAMWIAMERMKKPIIFKAGHYVPLSRPTFVSILRCSYSYFAVLNQKDP